MGKKRRKRKKLRWWTERTSSAYEVRSRLLTKAKRWILELMSRRETTKPVRKRRKRRSKQRQALSLQKIWQNLFLQFKPERRRRSKKRPLAKRIGRSCLKLMISLQQQITNLFVPKKRRRRRKSKQYAVYVMANQKKVN